MLLIDDEDELPEGPSNEETALSASLGEIGIREIDERICSSLSDHWEKTAKIIFDVMQTGNFNFTEESVDLHVRRVIHLNSLGALSSIGNLRKPRFSEIKL